MEFNRKHDLPSNENMHTLLTTFTPTEKKDLSEILHNLQDDRNPKLTIGMFFEFMKTAYQVNDNFESLATMLTSNSEIDWNKLAKINLNFETPNANVKTDERCMANSTTCQEKGCDATGDVSAQMHDNCNNINVEAQVSNTVNVMKTNVQDTFCSFLSSNVEISSVPGKINCIKGTENPRNPCMKQPMLNEIEEQTISKCNEIKGTNFEKNNQLANNQVENSKVLKSADTAESVLTTVMKKNLSDILHEGLLDSVLPYMIPKPVLSQPIIKKSIANTEIRKSSSLTNTIESRAVTNLSHKEKDRDKTKTCKKSQDNEVEIHVCDEDKNIKKNFRCPQKLLVQKMCYFADVTAGQKLEEIDISVHCDVVIFDWLMRWVKKDIIKKSEWPVLEASNVIPIMVSASFLQMEPLLESCLQYCHDNMSDILKTSTILTCLDDNLLTRLAERFTNEEVEMLKDKRDKIQSKLFCKLIVLLAEATPDNKKGHYSSLATLYKCSKCGKNIIQSVSNQVPCIASAIKIDRNGTIHSKHVRDLTWSLNDYIINLRAELRSWRKVYWRLWGDCHVLYCQQCNIYFPIHQMDWCSYHPELPQFFINEEQRPMPFPLGRYPCCSQRAYRFEALSSHEGCRYKEHIPDIKTQKDINILNIFTTNREVIAMEPPQLFFPEKITRLVARDPTLQPGKLLCKDTMWWAGIELMPQRPKFGLLGKIWSVSGTRRYAQLQDSQKMSQKVRQQVSVNTDTLSPTSSIVDSDEEEGRTGYEDSSVDEESYYSEESNAWISLKPMNKIKRRTRNQIIQRTNGRCWNSNLNVRHNQDNQRDFEERAAGQMVMLLTKRISTASSLLLKSPHKHGWKKNQPAGGIYVKLEAEFREQFNQSYKCKSSMGKATVRVRSHKA